MVKLLIGHKGSCKTKRMIELANETFQTSGVRIGTAPMTTRGYLEDDFRNVAHRIDDVVKELRAQKAAEAEEAK